MSKLRMLFVSLHEDDDVKVMENPVKDLLEWQREQRSRLQVELDKEFSGTEATMLASPGGSPPDQCGFGVIDREAKFRTAMLCGCSEEDGNRVIQKLLSFVRFRRVQAR